MTSISMPSQAQRSCWSKLVKLLLRGDPQWLRALAFGVAAGIEHLPVLRRLGSISTVVDIGANKGQFALACVHCFPDAAIESFEPLARPRKRFVRALGRSPNIRLHPRGIGPDRQQAVMHVSRRSDSSSLLPLAPLQVQLYPGTEERGTETVALGPLSDSLLPADIVEPAVLKIDVQGFELEALRGCRDALHRFKALYIECSFIELYQGQALAGEIIDWLDRRCFRLAGMYNLDHAPAGRPVQGDFLFRRSGAPFSSAPIDRNSTHQYRRTLFLCP